MNNKKKILIVDDSKFLRSALTKIVEARGYEVIDVAENGMEAVSKYRELKPDLVTLDIIMPQLDGLQTLRMLRAIDSNATIIMVSSMATQASVSDCLAAGAKNYILKPFDEEKVIAIIEKTLA